MQIVTDSDIAKTNELVKALNDHLAELVSKYPDVEVRTNHGYGVGVRAWVGVEFTHGRVVVGPF